MGTCLDMNENIQRISIQPLPQRLSPLPKSTRDAHTTYELLNNRDLSNDLNPLEYMSVFYIQQDFDVLSIRINCLHIQQQKTKKSKNYSLVSYQGGSYIFISARFFKDLK